jgi:hypothetical protein
MKNSAHRSSFSRGFALVVTLSLMILLTVIAVGLLTLSTISLRSASQGNAQATAQANARLALMLAIGDLQKQLGPDQRISITADQRLKPGGDGAESASDPEKRQWTGVFDSWPAISDTRPTPVFRSWLVSGDPAKVSQIAEADTELTGSDFIELVGAGTLGTTSTGLVRVPTVSLVSNGKPAGRLAWWIGDQGVKAAVSTQPASTETSLAVLRGNLQSAPRNACELAAAGATQPFAGLAVNDPRTQLVTSWQQAGLLLADHKSPRPLFHDLAASTTGLLTNVRSGGFRKDLSMKMGFFRGICVDLCKFAPCVG